MRLIATPKLYNPPRPLVGWKANYNFVNRPVQPTNKTSSKSNSASTSDKKKQTGLSRQDESNANLFDALNSVENEDDLGMNGGNSNLAEKGADSGVVSSAHGSSPLASNSLNITPIAEWINKLKIHILDGKFMLVDDDGKPINKADSDLVNLNYDSDVEVAYDETAQFMASGGVNDTSLYKDADYDIYDTYDIEGLTKQELGIFYTMDINLHRRSRR
nr:hypothetical protein [Tanacetum cinerariifolium]